MNRRFLYTKKALFSFRIISLLCGLLLIVSEVWSLFGGVLADLRMGQEVDFHIIFCHFINLSAIIFFAITIFSPQKFGFTAIIAFVYSASIIPFEPENYMGIMMFFLGTAILFARGLMKEHQKEKLVILFISLLGLLLTQLRFGLSVFGSSFIISIGGILVLGMLVFFLRAYYSNNLIYEEKKLNIASFPGLSERDFRILQGVQVGMKYLSIANEMNLTEGTIKNRMHQIFNILETGDRQGFMSYYSDWELYYNPQTAEADLAKMMDSAY